MSDKKVKKTRKYHKRGIRGVLMGILIFCLLCGCGGEELPETTADNAQWESGEEKALSEPVILSNEIAVGEDGYYYRITRKWKYNNIMFFDRSTMEQYPVCSRPECGHDGPECTAYVDDAFYRGGIWYYDGRIYLIKMEKGYNWLYSMDAAGGEKECLFEIGDQDYNGANTYQLYFRDGSVYINCTATEAEEHAYIRRRSLDGREDELIYENTGGRRLDEMQGYSGRLYFKEYEFDGDYSNQKTTGTRLLAYDYDTGETKEIELGDFSGYCLSLDERFCFFYRVNDGLYRRDMATGEEVKLYESEKGYNLFRMRCVGEYLLVADSEATYASQTKEAASLRVFDFEGELLNRMIGGTYYDGFFFGDNGFLFGRTVKGGERMYYTYIPMTEIESVKYWYFFDLPHFGEE